MLCCTPEPAGIRSWISSARPPVGRQRGVDVDRAALGGDHPWTLTPRLQLQAPPQAHGLPCPLDFPSEHKARLLQDPQ